MNANNKKLKWNWEIEWKKKNYLEQKREQHRQILLYKSATILKYHTCIQIFNFFVLLLFTSVFLHFVCCFFQSLCGSRACMCALLHNLYRYLCLTDREHNLSKRTTNTISSAKAFALVYIFSDFSNFFPLCCSSFFRTNKRKWMKFITKELKWVRSRSLTDKEAWMPLGAKYMYIWIFYALIWKIEKEKRE